MQAACDAQQPAGTPPPQLRANRLSKFLDKKAGAGKSRLSTSRLSTSS